jgi:hypothetical protein
LKEHGSRFYPRLFSDIHADHGKLFFAAQTAQPTTAVAATTTTARTPTIAGRSPFKKQKHLILFKLTIELLSKNRDNIVSISLL